MRFPLLTTVLAAITFALPSAAQKLQAADATSMRAESRIMVHNADYSTFAMASITHGQPAWKSTYDGMLDSLKGKMNRLGMDWFTTLITSSELEIGGTKLPAGSYIVGLHCDKEGKFALGFLCSTKAMKDGVMPPMDWKPEMTAPLTLNKGVAKEAVSKMSMTFAAEKEGAGKGTFTLAWGTHTLTAPVMLHAPKK